MSNADKNWKNKALREIDEVDSYAISGALRIPVAELVRGHRLVSSWRWDSTGTVRSPLKTTLVETIVPCEGNNGMHRHVNKSNCYDSRAFVWVAQ